MFVGREYERHRASSIFAPVEACVELVPVAKPSMVSVRVRDRRWRGRRRRRRRRRRRSGLRFGRGSDHLSDRRSDHGRRRGSHFVQKRRAQNVPRQSLLVHGRHRRQRGRLGRRRTDQRRRREFDTGALRQTGATHVRHHPAQLRICETAPSIRIMCRILEASFPIEAQVQSGRPRRLELRVAGVVEVLDELAALARAVLLKENNFIACSFGLAKDGGARE